MRLLLDNPNSFFRKNREKLSSDALYMAVFGGVFALLNEAVIRAGLTTFVPVVGALESFVVNYIALMAGFFILVFIFSILHAGRYGFMKSFSKSFFVLAYTITPVFALGWVPFAVIKAVALVWALFFMTIGISAVMKYDYKKSAFMTIFVIIVVYSMIVLSRNEVLSIIPIYRS